MAKVGSLRKRKAESAHLSNCERRIPERMKPRGDADSPTHSFILKCTEELSLPEARENASPLFERFRSSGFGQEYPSDLLFELQSGGEGEKDGEEKRRERLKRKLFCEDSPLNNNTAEAVDSRLAGTPSATGGTGCCPCQDDETLGVRSNAEAAVFSDEVVPASSQKGKMCLTPCKSTLIPALDHSFVCPGAPRKPLHPGYCRTRFQRGSRVARVLFAVDDDS